MSSGLRSTPNVPVSYLHWAVPAECPGPCCSRLRPSKPCCAGTGPGGLPSGGPDPTRASAGFVCKCRTSQTQTRTVDRWPEPAEGPASSLYKPDHVCKTNRSYENLTWQKQGGRQFILSVYKWSQWSCLSRFREEHKHVLQTLYLNSIFQGSSQQKESRGMLEALFSEQRESVLHSCFPPAIFTEVIAEERSHLRILLRPSTHRSSLWTEALLMSEWHFSMCVCVCVTCTIPKPQLSSSWPDKTRLRLRGRCFSDKQLLPPGRRERMNICFLNSSFPHVPILAKPTHNHIIFTENGISLVRPSQCICEAY